MCPSAGPGYLVGVLRSVMRCLCRYNTQTSDYFKILANGTKKLESLSLSKIEVPESERSRGQYT